MRSLIEPGGLDLWMIEMGGALLVLIAFVIISMVNMRGHWDE